MTEARRIAAIDIGTNSTKMMVAEAGAGGRPTPIIDRSQITRLGAGVDSSGQLREDAIRRTLDAVVLFAAEARSLGAQTVLAAGTSALRDAANGARFLQAAFEEAGVTVEIVDGPREARLAYSAVRNDPDLGLPDHGALLVFDVGGGSTELIVGLGDGEPLHSRSLDIGAVRLTERFLHSDPPSDSETDALESHVRTALAEFPRPDGPVAVGGIGGTAVNLAAVETDRSVKDVHGVTVTRGAVASLYDRFCGMTVSERLLIRGLEPERADIIVAGAAILNEILTRFMAAHFVVSTRGLRYGLIADYLSAGEDRHPHTGAANPGIP
ncbi:MAG: Ppx/GppA family phosphatase [Capsulimonadaceae bacterium]